MPLEGKGHGTCGILYSSQKSLANKLTVEGSHRQCPAPIHNEGSLPCGRSSVWALRKVIKANAIGSVGPELQQNQNPQERSPEAHAHCLSSPIAVGAHSGKMGDCKPGDMSPESMPPDLHSILPHGM